MFAGGLRVCLLAAFNSLPAAEKEPKTFSQLIRRQRRRIVLARAASPIEWSKKMNSISSNAAKIPFSLFFFYRRKFRIKFAQRGVKWWQLERENEQVKMIFPSRAGYWWRSRQAKAFILHLTNANDICEFWGLKYGEIMVIYVYWKWYISKLEKGFEIRAGSLRAWAFICSSGTRNFT